MVLTKRCHEVVRRTGVFSLIGDVIDGGSDGNKVKKTRGANEDEAHDRDEK